MESIRVAVVDEHEIFRRGIVACLAEDPAFVVVSEPAEGPVSEQADVVVASTKAAIRHRFGCPVVVCGNGSALRGPTVSGNSVLGVLPRGSVTPRQLLAAVHAAAAGFRIDVAQQGSCLELTERSLEVLRLLADGAATEEIAAVLRYSERTIKSLIHQLQQQLGAKSRAQAVAEGIRQGYI